MARKPVSTDEAARRALEADWAKRLAKFEELATTNTDELSEDDVHDLRVTTRRLRAALWVLRHCMLNKTAERCHRELRSVGMALGERRMWDIAQRDAESHGADTSEIERQRGHAHAKLRRALERSRIRRLVTTLQKLEAELPGVMLEKLAPWLQGYEWELAYRLVQPPKTPETRHELRIQAKKTRYVLECLGRRAPSLEKLQDHLGREHDLHLLRGIIGAKRGLAADARAAHARANRVMPAALRSGMRQLHMLQRDLTR
ncbi:MAG TPA: CHAD domain-containing protein [Candidatus Krumholzibacteria bacterium]|nr:CHAD domain-containing protein [Candidatus Krumholzibacteria bacterium]